MIDSLRYSVVVAAVLTCSSFALSGEPTPSENETSRLRLFNTTIFGKTAAEPVVLLKPARPGELDPATVMVDIEDGKYFAATLRYRKEVTFADARRSLNTVYAKHEKKDFANFPSMGLWRNERDGFSIQLSEDEDSLVVIYIKFRALRATEKKDGQP